MSLRVAFMGTPDFAVPALEQIVQAGHEVACVYSQPPRPSGRGHKVKPSPVQARAEALGLPVRHPERLKGDEEKAAFAALDPDIAVVAAYGLILPQAILDAPRMGCLNIHGSLLPRWRGAAPIQRAILAGDSETGITIMQMEAGLDTGPMLMKKAVPIDDRTTAQTLHDALAGMGAEMIVRALELAEAGRLSPEIQPADGVTYAEKLTRADGVIDWRSDAALIDRQIRALDPWPGCSFTHAGQKIRALQARPARNMEHDHPGTILDDALTIACGEGAITLARVQRPGRGPVTGAEFMRATGLRPGDRLDG